MKKAISTKYPNVLILFSDQHKPNGSPQQEQEIPFALLAARSSRLPEHLTMEACTPDTGRRQVITNRQKQQAQRIF